MIEFIVFIFIIIILIAVFKSTMSATVNPTSNLPANSTAGMRGKNVAETKAVQGVSTPEPLRELSSKLVKPKIKPAIKKRSYFGYDTSGNTGQKMVKFNSSKGIRLFDAVTGETKDIVGKT